MATTIKTSSAAAQSATNELEEGLKEYVAFGLDTISGELPVAGSITHDDTIQKAIKEALPAWESLLKNDQKNVVRMHEALKAADQQSATSIKQGFVTSPGVGIKTPPSIDPQNKFRRP